MIQSIFGISQPTSRNWTVEQYAADPLLRSAVANNEARIPYKLYLRTAWWAHRRQLALKADDYACTICSSRNHLQVHHLTYINLWNEDAMDLTVLCDACHRSETGRLSAQLDPRRRGYAPKYVNLPTNIIRLIKTTL